MLWLRKVGKAIVGVVTGVASLPIVQSILLDNPMAWTFEHAIAGVVVGVSVYLIPNKDPEKEFLMSTVMGVKRNG